MSKVQELCAEVLRLDGAATPRPWEEGQAGSMNIVHFDGEDIRGIANAGFSNAALIVNYRTAAPSMAQILVGVCGFAADLERKAQEYTASSKAGNDAAHRALADQGYLFEQAAKELRAILESEKP